MTGYVFCMGRCGACGRPMSFNPHRVPSFDFDKAKGIPNGRGKEPICRDCMGRLNARCRAEGRPEFPILPGAYEPLPEGEL